MSAFLDPCPEEFNHIGFRIFGNLMKFVNGKGPKMGLYEFLMEGMRNSPDFPIRREDVKTVFLPFRILSSGIRVSSTQSQKYSGPT